MGWNHRVIGVLLLLLPVLVSGVSGLAGRGVFASSSEGSQSLVYCVDLSSEYKVIQGSEVKYSESVEGSVRVEVDFTGNSSVVVKIVDYDVNFEKDNVKGKLDAFLAEKFLGFAEYNESQLYKSINVGLNRSIYIPIVLMNKSAFNMSSGGRGAAPVLQVPVAFYTPIKSPDDFVRGVKELFGYALNSSMGQLGQIMIDAKHGEADLKILRSEDTVGYTVKSSFNNGEMGLSYSGRETTIYSLKGWLVKDSYKITATYTQQDFKRESKENINIVLCDSTVPGISPVKAGGLVGSVTQALNNRTTVIILAIVVLLAVTAGAYYLRRRA